MPRVEQLQIEACRANMVRGQAKRVPLDVRRPLFGYVVACPSCGRVTFASPVMDVVVVEVGGCLTSARFPCDGCLRIIEIEGGEFQ